LKLEAMETMEHLSDEQFVDRVFQQYLQRQADEGARAFYVGRLRDGASRFDVIQSVITGNEFFDLLCRQAHGPQSGRQFLTFAPPGHYYSPIPSGADVDALGQTTVSPEPDTCRGVDLRIPEQLARLAALQPFADDLMFSNEPGQATRYYLDNDSFAPGDAVFLSTLMRQRRPSRIVEIGAGYSTAVMCDVNERYLDRAVRIDAVDPEPARVRALLRGDEDDMLTIHETIVQQVPFSLFTSLRANDILFVDSSHVLKLGSDVGLILFEVLPRLEPGVFVHFHDIAWPFEYPIDWYREGRAWNEAYALRAFLAYNPTFPIVLFANYLLRYHREVVRRHMPLATRQPRGIPDYEATACSLWLMRAGA
jgi:uncharacterized UPF0146 family protein